MTRSITASPVLCDGAGVERRLRVVLDHQLRRLGRRAVDEQLDEPQRHVDAARHAGGGDDPPVEVLDDAVSPIGIAPSFGEHVAGADQCVVAVRPSSSPAAASTSEPVHTDVVYVVVSWAVRTQSSTPLVVDQLPGADAAGEDDDVGVGSSSNVGVDLDAEEPVLGADHAALVADERDVEARDALQHLVRADAVEGGEAGTAGWRWRSECLPIGAWCQRGVVAAVRAGSLSSWVRVARSGGGSRRADVRGGGRNVRRIVSACRSRPVPRSRRRCRRSSRARGGRRRRVRRAT